MSLQGHDVHHAYPYGAHPHTSTRRGGGSTHTHTHTHTHTASFVQQSAHHGQGNNGGNLSMHGRGFTPMRADPAMMPLGAMSAQQSLHFTSKRPHVTEIPPLSQQTTNTASSASAPLAGTAAVATTTTSAATGSGASSSQRPGTRNLPRRASLSQLILDLIEEKFPFIGIIRYAHIEIRPHPPDVHHFGLTWCAVVYSAAVILRRVIAGLAFLDNHTRNSILYSPRLIFLIVYQWTRVPMFILGFTVSFTIRNFQFWLPVTYLRLLFGLFAFLILTFSGCGTELLLGAWVGAYWMMAINYRDPSEAKAKVEAKKKKDKELTHGQKAAPFVHEKWS